MPTEATHKDILDRLDAVEHTQALMQGQISRLSEKADISAQASSDNREAMDEVKAMLAKHAADFGEFRGQVLGAAMVVKWGLPIGMGALVTVVGWALLV